MCDEAGAIPLELYDVIIILSTAPPIQTNSGDLLFDFPATQRNASSTTTCPFFSRVYSLPELFLLYIHQLESVLASLQIIIIRRMPRPSSQTSNSGSTFSGIPSWTPPLFLTGERQPAKPRHWSIPIPSVDAQTLQAVQQFVTIEPFSSEKKQVATLKTKYADQQKKVQLLQDRLVELETRKEQGIRDIRAAIQEQTEAKIQSVKKELQLNLTKELQQRELEWKQQIEQEYNNKRKLEQEEKEKEQEQEHVKKDEKDTTDEPAAKKQKSEETTTNTDSDVELKQKTTNETQPVAPPSKSQLLSKELTQLQAALDSLQEQRTETVWLLKQVIKLEEKKKFSDNSDQKPEAKTMASKQA